MRRKRRKDGRRFLRMEKEVEGEKEEQMETRLGKNITFSDVEKKNSSQLLGLIPSVKVHRNFRIPSAFQSMRGGETTPPKKEKKATRQHRLKGRKRKELGVSLIIPIAFAHERPKKTGERERFSVGRGERGVITASGTKELSMEVYIWHNPVVVLARGKRGTG